MTEVLECNVVPDIKFIVFRKCTPSWYMPEDVFPAWNISYVISGEAEYIIDHKKYTVTAGDLLCRPGGCIRSGKTFPDRLMQCFSVDFELKQAPHEATSIPFPILSHIGVRKDIIQLFHELSSTWVDKQPGYAMKLRGLFILILSRLFELTVYKIDSSSGDYRIKKVTRHIAIHYAEKLSVQEMAAMVELNTVYFGSLFQRETGCTMKQYISKTRIRNAENMLRSGEYKVKEVAENCGYSDVFIFYKQFKAIMGFPPSQCIPNREIR
jgi:AraC-like DNA-binding protein